LYFEFLSQAVQRLAELAENGFFIPSTELENLLFEKSLITSIHPQP
jgi:hypothetical protein